LPARQLLAARVATIAGIQAEEGWLYLSSVLDLGSRRLLGWKMDDNMATPLVADALAEGRAG
jgi:transposase InsO family protein